MSETQLGQALYQTTLRYFVLTIIVSALWFTHMRTLQRDTSLPPLESIRIPVEKLWWGGQTHRDFVVVLSRFRKSRDFLPKKCLDN